MASSSASSARSSAARTIPSASTPAPLAVANGKDGDAAGPSEPQALGNDPDTGRPVSVRPGPYGPYIQLGEKDDEEKPKRVSLPKGITADEMTLEVALRLLALPREVGMHPESGKPILAGIGRYGPYVQHEKVYKSLETADDVLTIGLNRAVDLLAQPGRGRRGGNGSANTREVGEHPADGKKISAGVGRYGPYVRHGRTFASLPKDMKVEAVTLDEAVALIDAKNAKSGKKPAAKAKAKASKGRGKAKASAKKPAAKKSSASRRSKSDATSAAGE